MCDYQGDKFGARFTDWLRCGGGYLYDDAPYYCRWGFFSIAPNEMPCPACNTKEWLKYIKETVIELGYNEYYNGLDAEHNPFLPTGKHGNPTATYQLRTWWLDGYREALTNQSEEG